MKKFKVTFEAIFGNCENEEQAYDVLLKYLSECVQNQDVTAFDFTERIDVQRDEIRHE